MSPSEHFHPCLQRTENCPVRRLQQTESGERPHRQRTGRRHRLFFRRQKAPQGTRGKA